MATEVSTEPLAAPATPAIPWRKLISGGSIVVLGTAASNVLSFLFSFATARLLQPADYATVTACLSLLVVVTVPAATLQLIAARFTAIWWRDEPARADALILWLSRGAAGLGCALALALIGFAGFFVRYLHLSSAAPLLLVAGILVCGFLSPVYRGLLQGQHRFGRYALVTSFEFFVRLAFGVALILGGAREAGALGGVLLGAAASAALGWWLARPTAPRTGATGFPMRDVLIWAAPTLLVQGALNLMLFQDTLFAKHYFGAAEAGAYAGLATTGRVLVYVSGALTMFLFPVVARSSGIGRQTRLISNATLGLMVAIEAAALLIISVAPNLALRFAVGGQYVAVSGLLAPLALALAAYAIVNLLVSYLLATTDRAFLVPLLAAPVAEALLFSLFHRSLGDFVHALDAVMLATAVILFGLYCRSHAGTLVRELEVA